MDSSAGLSYCSRRVCIHTTGIAFWKIYPTASRPISRFNAARSGEKGLRIGAANARNAPPSSPTGANSVPVLTVRRRMQCGRWRVLHTPFLDCVDATAASRSRTAMLHQIEQPTLFELTACDGFEARRGCTPEPGLPSVTPKSTRRLRKLTLPQRSAGCSGPFRQGPFVAVFVMWCSAGRRKQLLLGLLRSNTT